MSESRQCGGETNGDEWTMRFRRRAEALASSASPTVLAVSGGADSIALAHLWASAFPDRLGRTAIAHFDHRLRADSGHDLTFVAELAGKLGCAFASESWQAPQPGEAAARIARYAFLGETARKLGAGFVATAHTADDQAETVLFRMARGAGLAGLAGMPIARPLAPGVTLIRPLLGFRREELRGYLQQRRATWREDPTNTRLDFARNRIRERIFPELHAGVNPRATEHLCELADHARAAAEFFDRWADAELARLGWEPTATDEAVLPLAELTTLGDFERRMLVRRALQRLGWPMGRIDAELLARAAQVVDAFGPAAVQLPGRVEVRRQLSSLTLRRMGR